MKDARYWIEKLQLAKHPEGGYYRETYRCARQIEGRACSTAIYFLLPADEVSAFHRIRSDEVWHFYDGVGSSRVDLQACKLEYSIVSPK